MKIEQIYTGCLAQGTYYIESMGEVAIIDPLRETETYLKKTVEKGLKIKYIFETHFHADFVSGHVDLAKKSGGQIIYGSKATADFDFYGAKDGEIFELGELKIKALHTPGHTLESTTYLLFDKANKEYAIFTGDTLFIGDVGRPDLAQKGEMTQEDLAGLLYDSLRNKIMPLPDEIIVYPAHGAGSACGKNMSKETSDILGNQKKTNYALRTDMTKEEFIQEVTNDLLPPPYYFAKNVAINKQEVVGVDKILEKGNKALILEEFEYFVKDKGALILDTRPQTEFVKGHIPQSIFIGIDGNFAPWVGTLIDNIQQPILFIAANGREEEVIMRLSRVGYDMIIGYLKGGFDTWKQAGKKIETLKSITAQEFEESYKNTELNVLDVRKPGEYKAKHVADATNMPLDFFGKQIEIDKNNKIYHIYCAGGYRSVIAASILKLRGFHNLVDVAGGFSKIKTTDILLAELTS